MRKRTDGPRADGPRRLDLVGVDPNDAMESFARANLDKASKDAPQIDASLRVVHGVAEALPLPANCADAVVCTLTLCSVSDPAAAVAEMRRILKPGAPLLFIEHVLSEDDPGLAAQQLRFNACRWLWRTGAIWTGRRSTSFAPGVLELGGGGAVHAAGVRAHLVAGLGHRNQVKRTCR